MALSGSFSISRVFWRICWRVHNVAGYVALSVALCYAFNVAMSPFEKRVTANGRQMRGTVQIVMVWSSACQRSMFGCVFEHRQRHYDGGLSKKKRVGILPTVGCCLRSGKLSGKVDRWMGTQGCSNGTCTGFTCNMCRVARVRPGAERYRFLMGWVRAIVLC